MVALNDSNSVPRFPSRAHPRVQGSIFATKHRTVHQEPSLTRSYSHSQALQGKSTSSPRRLHRADHSNQQYSILALTDTSGAVVERVAYQAYGQPTFTNAAGTTLSASAKATRYSYTGREWDASLELHHFRARWMSGVGGRFLGRDPIGYIGGIDVYEFVGSQPVNWTDSLGLLSGYFDSDNFCVSCSEMLDTYLALAGLQNPIDITPSRNGKFEKCRAHLACETDCGGASGMTSMPDETGRIKICMKELGATPLRFHSTLQHELQHARDICNIGDFASDCERCVAMEERGYQISCRILHPGNVEAQQQCVSDGVYGSCHWLCSTNPLDPNIDWFPHTDSHLLPWPPLFPWESDPYPLPEAGSPKIDYIR